MKQQLSQPQLQPLSSPLSTAWHEFQLAAPLDLNICTNTQSTCATCCDEVVEEGWAMQRVWRCDCVQKQPGMHALSRDGKERMGAPMLQSWDLSCLQTATPHQLHHRSS
jgi:hypothetical protein